MSIKERKLKFKPKFSLSFVFSIFQKVRNQNQKKQQQLKHTCRCIKRNDKIERDTLINCTFKIANANE